MCGAAGAAACRVETSEELLLDELSLAAALPTRCSLYLPVSKPAAWYDRCPQASVFPAGGSRDGLHYGPVLRSTRVLQDLHHEDSMVFVGPDASARGESCKGGDSYDHLLKGGGMAVTKVAWRGSVMDGVSSFPVRCVRLYHL